MFFFSDEVCVESRLTPCVVVKVCRIFRCRGCVLPFLAWGDFHARSRFARSTIPEEKGGLLVVYPRVTDISFLSITSQSREKVLRINIIITKGKML